MQREIEVKVLNIEPKEIEEKLIRLGANKISHEFQKNYTFVPKEGAFKDGYLRIRETEYENEEKSLELTFKRIESDDDFRVNNEYTVNIDSVSMMIKILEELDIKLEYEGEKERISYSYKEQRFDIDIWDKNTYPNPYMEIEFSNKDKMDEIISDLSIEKQNITTESITELREKLNK